MKIADINKRSLRFLNKMKMRKLILAAITLAVIVVGALGCFYYQLLKNNSMTTLLAALGIVIAIVLTIVGIMLRKKDDYYRFITITYASKMDTSDARNAKELYAKIGGMLDPIVGGFQGFNARIADNKRLLVAMLDGDCTAFPEYADKGIRTKFAKLMLPRAFSSFNYFALMDCILQGQGDNHKYQVMASTRWFQVYKKYSSTPMKAFMSIVAPFVLWFIGSSILISVVDSQLDICGAIENLIRFGTLGLVLQLKNLEGNLKLFTRFAADITDTENPPKIPSADYNICMAFAELSQYYYGVCVECGYIQTTSPQNDEAMIEMESDPMQLE